MKILDVEGIATLLDVKRETVWKWRDRQQLPEPTGFVSSRPYWDYAVIHAWALETGRASQEVVDSVFEAPSAS